MSENEMLNKKETLEEALGEEIEAVKGTVEEAAENAADKTLEDLEAENEKLRQELELMKEKTVKERIYDHVHGVRADDGYFYWRDGGAVCGGCGAGNFE